MPGRLLAGGVRFRSWLADQWACNTHLQAVLFGFHNTSMATAWAVFFLHQDTLQCLHSIWSVARPFWCDPQPCQPSSMWTSLVSSAVPSRCTSCTTRLREHKDRTQGVSLCVCVWRPSACVLVCLDCVLEV